MITFIKDELHFSRQRTVFFVILQDHFIKVYFDLDIRTGFQPFHRGTFERTAQELYMSSILQLSFKCIAYTFFLHNMNIKRLHQQPHFRTDFKMMIILNKELISATKHSHFIVYPFEDRSLYHTGQLRHLRNRENIKVFRTNDYVHRSIFTETFVHAFKLRTTKAYQFIMNHRSVENITFSDKIRNK